MQKEKDPTRRETGEREGTMMSCKSDTLQDNLILLFYFIFEPKKLDSKQRKILNSCKSYWVPLWYNQFILNFRVFPDRGLSQKTWTTPSSRCSLPLFDPHCALTYCQWFCQVHLVICTTPGSVQMCSAGDLFHTHPLLCRQDQLIDQDSVLSYQAKHLFHFLQLTPFFFCLLQFCIKVS